MTLEQMLVVRESFVAVRPIAATAASLFYGRLFELDPSLLPMFVRDLDEQSRMLMQVIGVAAVSLDRFEAVVPRLRDLGRRDAGYGVRDGRYGVVAVALLWTLQQGLGQQFTPNVRNAWTVAYGLKPR